MGVLKVFSKQERMHYFLENLSFWNYDIIKYNETSIMASKNDVNTIDILKEDSEYSITWHGQESKKIAKSYYNLFKNAEGAYIISSTHTFPPEPIGGKRAPSPPVDPREVIAMKKAWFAYGFVACLILALIAAAAMGTFGGDGATTTTPPPATTAPPTTLPPTTEPPSTSPPATTLPPTTLPPTTEPPSVESLLESLEEMIESQGINVAEVSLEEEGGLHVLLSYRLEQDGGLETESAIRGILSSYAAIVLQQEIAPRLVAKEVVSGAEHEWYCLTAWTTAYNKGFYSLDDVYARVIATYA
jgi:hypothetical protein